ncbi:IclR family transcriptional regulator [Paracoccus yeei]|uniref:IclR family transcriptional regulator n=1 Tax=Paracoccus yeei TaxID=147645 RepID=A0A2D2BWH8_9RHOB|nr:IclR family transcriptional regulator [Paracoccus yeei]ATQ54554.1 IclR family transcriptional regulator [Paracoccus yeei]
MRKRAKSTQEKDADQAPNSAASLTRGLEILRAFGPEDETLGNQDIIDRTGLPKATVSRLTLALVQLGYLRYIESLGRYCIGAATVSLGYNGLSSIAVVRMAQPILQDLSEQTGLAAAIGTRDQLEMVYLANSRAMGSVSLQLNVGSRLPMLRTAMGMAYLAAMSPAKREEVSARIIAQQPDQADDLRRQIDTAIESYEAKGFIGSYGVWYSYINAVGVAFRPEDGSPLMGLTCGGIVDIASREKCETVLKDALLRSVERLKAVLRTGRDPGR